MNNLNLPYLGEPVVFKTPFEFGLLGDSGESESIGLKNKLLLARLGYNLPLKDGNLNVGLMGQKVDISSPFFNMNEKRLSGIDATYSRPNDFFRFSVNRQPEKNSQQLQNVFNFLYGRSF